MSAVGTLSGWLIGASSTKDLPVPSSSSAAAWRARRVFPDPPAPVRVTSLDSRTRGPDFGELGATPDERAQGGRQVVGELGIFEGAKRWELGLEPLGDELKEHLGSSEVLEAVRAEVPESDLAAQGVLHQHRRC